MSDVLPRSRLDLGLSRFSLSDTSIRSLITQKCGSNTACGETILRGSSSLGHFLANKGYQVSVLWFILFKNISFCR